MILADKIIDERKKAGWSQEELAQKLNVSRQAVSKWESAQASPDLRRIVQMAELFGVSTDYLLKDNETVPAANEPTQELEGTSLRTVSLQDAQEFLALKRTQAPQIALGVSLCLLGPAMLMLLCGLSLQDPANISEDTAGSVGAIIMLIFIALAVFLFVTAGIKAKRFEYLEKEPFETAYGVSGLANDKKRAFEGIYTRQLATGIVLCILAVVPVLACGAITTNDAIPCFAVALTLTVVAIGVNMIIRAGIINASYEMLLQEGDFSRDNKRVEGKLGAFSAIYWCLVTALYLGWSFSTMEWSRTWIVWPVAGVLFAALYTLAKSLVQHHEGK